MTTSGNDLKVERVRARVKQGDLAARMGVSRQTLWTIERAAVVDAEQVMRYLRALATFDDVATRESVA